jgi:hypothetical protein
VLDSVNSMQVAGICHCFKVLVKECANKNMDLKYKEYGGAEFYGLMDTFSVCMQKV